MSQKESITGTEQSPRYSLANRVVLLATDGTSTSVGATHVAQALAQELGARHSGGQRVRHPRRADPRRDRRGAAGRARGCRTGCAHRAGAGDSAALWPRRSDTTWIGRYD